LTSIGRISEAKVSLAIVAPRPSRPVDLGGQRIEASTRHAHEARPDLLRRGVRCRRSITQLAVVVVAPGPKRSVRLYGEAVVIVRSDGRESAPDEDRCWPVVAARSIPDLTICVQSPTPKIAVRC